MSHTTKKKADKHATRQIAKKPKRKTLIIKRSEWARGLRYAIETRVDSYSGKEIKDKVEIDNLLFGEDGMKCCLGFLALSCKIPTKDIDDRNTPSCVPSSRWPKWLVKNRGQGSRNFLDHNQINTDAGNALMKINDNQTMNWQTREKEIRQEMAKHGVDVKFVP